MLHTSFLHSETLSTCDAQLWLEQKRKNKRLKICHLFSSLRVVFPSEWNLELSSRCKTYRANGRPKRRWEYDINELLKLEDNETENSIENDNKYNKSWIKAATDRGRWTLSENDYTMIAEDLK